MSRRPGKPEWPADLRAKLKLLPDAPGIYLHKNGQGKVIYIGKAKRLSQRVRSYFGVGSDLDAKTKELVRQIRDLDYIATTSESEALVLENQLIKEYRPRYNIQLRDDKQYPYIRISLGEPFPRVTVVRRMACDGARYFGPYTSVRDMRETLKFATGVFQVRTCHLDLPDQTVARPCLDHQIGRCSAPCVGYDDAASYRRKVRQLILFLEGADKRLLKHLREQMQRLSRATDFEQAARVRDRIHKLERTITRSRNIAGLQEDLDACGLARDGKDACGVILRVRQGRILTVHHFLLRDRLQSGLEAFQAQLLREFYPRAGEIPSQILLACDLQDRPAWENWLASLRGRRVALKRPRRGRKRQVAEMAQANATFKLGEVTLGIDRKVARRFTRAEAQLQEALGLHTMPDSIECFDISNFLGREAVGSLVYFKGGTPLKSRYRRFRVRRVARIDDYAMMAEILDRYYGRLAGQSALPADLVVVDGGPGQLGAARDVLTRYGFHATEVVGLAKREETIYREHGLPPVNLARGSEALKLLQRVRDEAHRFAITYHRLVRDQRTSASVLDRIPGIGRVKKLSLLHHFGSVAAIRKAEPTELEAVRGLTRRDVAAIITFFAGEESPG